MKAATLAIVLIIFALAGYMIMAPDEGVTIPECEEDEVIIRHPYPEGELFCIPLDDLQEEERLVGLSFLPTPEPLESPSCAL